MAFRRSLRTVAALASRPADAAAAPAETALLASRVAAAALVRSHMNHRGFFASSRAASGAGSLIAPHGGTLVNLMVSDAAKAAAIVASATRSLELSHRNACDVELLATGGFSPLRGFMNEDVYAHCVENMRLPGSNLLFGMPIVLDTDCEDTKVGDKVVLKYQGKDVAVVTVESKWKPNKARSIRWSPYDRVGVVNADP